MTTCSTMIRVLTKKPASLAAATAVACVALLAPPLATASPDATGRAASACSECCQSESLCEALDALADLHGAVDELVPEPGLASSLDAKVDAATSSVLRGMPTTALNQLDAFGNELTAADQAGKIPSTTSNLLKAQHDSVKQVVENLRG